MKPLMGYANKRSTFAMRRVKFLAFLVALAPVIFMSGAPGAFAQSVYPSQPIRFVVPYTAGGGADNVARLFGNKLAEALGQPVIIENRGGAGGNIGTNVAAKADPNGYTIMLGAAALAINVTLYDKLPFDPVKDFTPVSLLVKTPNILVVNPKVPVKTVKELIELAKNKPGVLNYASAGNGTTPHLAGELFDSMAGVKMTHVPYKGSSPAVVALVGGEVDVMLSPALTVLPFIKSGKLRALAMTGSVRSPAFPDIPTVAESGLPGYEASQWYAVFAPAGTPADIVTRLSRELVKIAGLPDVKKILQNEGSEPIGSTPQQLDEYFKSEITRWAKTIRP